MKVFLVYDSVYGNTEKIAKAIAEALAVSAEVKLARAGEADTSKLKAGDLLIVGSPIHGGRAAPAVQTFLDRIPANALTGVVVAAFDTRMEMWIAHLKAKGGREAAPPQGYIVKGRQGPLRDGELERAASWARSLAR
jgi:flavodoxin